MTQTEHDARPWQDQIVEEVRTARLRLFASCEYDLEKLANRLREVEKAHGRVAVSYPKRNPSKELAT